MPGDARRARDGRWLVEPTDDAQRGPAAPLPDAVIEVDPDGRIEVVDARAEQLFGWPAQDLVGCPVDVIVADRVTDPGPRPAGVDLVLSVRRREGPPFPAEIRLSAGSDAHHGRRVALAIRDCSANHGAAEPGRGPVHDAGQRPVRTNDDAGISGIAHDLNNVISVMLIYSELLERAVHGRSMDEYLGEIRAAANHGAELTGQLRSWARQTAPDPAAAAESARPRVRGWTRTC